MNVFQNLLERDSFTQNDMLQVLREYQGLLGKCEALMHELNLWKGKAGTYYPGHFYSTVPDEEAFEALRQQFSNPHPHTLPEIDLRPEVQLAWIERFKPYYSDYPFGQTETPPYRFYNKNPYFANNDALMLHCMMRALQPKRLIEVGSGFSSALILDTNEFFCNRSIQCTFIEPYTERLNSLLKPADRSACTILQKPVQEVPLATFEALEPGDILFIDSSHVSKLKSDVNYLFFEVLPALQSGVYIHVHDILYPFEYPPDWHQMGMHWNEPYLLRAFLMNNSRYTIELFNAHLLEFYKPQLLAYSAELGKGGGSIWLKKQ